MKLLDRRLIDMNITQHIDERIEKLKQLRQEYIRNDDEMFASQAWARLDELKKLKENFTDKNGEWII